MLTQELERYSNKVESYLTKSNGIAIAQLDLRLSIIDCNLGFMRLFNPRQKPAGEQLSDYLEIDADHIRCDEQLKIPCSRKSGLDAINNCYLIQTDEGYLLFCDRLLLTESRALEQMGRLNDDLINLQRESVKKNHQLEKLRRELDVRIAELESALTRVKQLEGIIPICTYCKKIRDDQNSWQQLESYISDHSEAMFSHGACPDCLDEQMKIINKFK
jgi:hypothetical protein